MSFPRSEEADVLLNPRGKSSLAAALHEAREHAAQIERASLVNPSRPFTPATTDDRRHLFSSFGSRPGRYTPSTPSDSSRPGTAFYNVNSAQFLSNMPPPTPMTGRRGSIGPSPSPSESSVGRSRITPSPPQVMKVHSDEIGPAEAPLSPRRAIVKRSTSVGDNIVDSVDPFAPWASEPTSNDLDQQVFIAQVDPVARPPTPPGGSHLWRVVEDYIPQIKPSTDSSELLECLQNVWSVASTEEFLAEVTKREKHRLLRALSALVDLSDNNVLIKVAKIMLKVASNDDKIVQLCCNLLFKLSRKADCDHLFRTEDLLTPLLELVSRWDTLTEDTIIYTMGTLRNVSDDSDNQVALMKLNAVKVLSNPLSCVNAIDPSNPTESPHSAMLIQVTSTLRNLATSGASAKKFNETGVLELLCVLVSKMPKHAKLMYNVSRILSKLSLYDDCRAIINKDTHNISYLLNVLSWHSNDNNILIRVLFVLGNLTTTNNRVRRLVVFKFNALDNLLNLLAKHVSRSEQLAESDEAGEDEQKENDDVLIKLVRVIANLAIDREAGPAIASRQEILKLIDLLESRDVEDSEELVLNVVSSITNLSFYQSEENSIWTSRERAASLLIPLLLYDNEECVIEVVRAFGNFSRSQRVRTTMSKQRADEILVILLDHGNRDVVVGVCGVLMNVLADPNHSDIIPADGYDKLLGCLVDAADKDIPVTVAVAKTLFNCWLDENIDVMTGERAREMSDLLKPMLISIHDNLKALKQRRPPSEEGSSRKKTKEELKQLEKEKNLEKAMTEAVDVLSGLLERVTEVLEKPSTELEPLEPLPDTES